MILPCVISHYQRLLGSGQLDANPTASPTDDTAYISIAVHGVTSELSPMMQLFLRVDAHRIWDSLRSDVLAGLQSAHCEAGLATGRRLDLGVQEYFVYTP